MKADGVEDINEEKIEGEEDEELVENIMLDLSGLFTRPAVPQRKLERCLVNPGVMPGKG